MCDTLYHTMYIKVHFYIGLIKKYMQSNEPWLISLLTYERTEVTKTNSPLDSHRARNTDHRYKTDCVLPAV